MSIAGQHAVVVGGTAGIGLAIARAAHAAGARVTVASRSRDKVDRAVASLEGAQGLRLDLTDVDEVQRAFASLGDIDHLVVTAAEVRAGAFRELSITDAQHSMASKFWGPYVAARAARVRNSGSITLFSGIFAKRPSPGFAVLSAINAAVESLGRALAVELAPIRVNVISPGLIRDTDALAGMSEAARESLFSATAERLPVRRVGTPSDVAALVLAIMDNPYMTGATVEIDGGGSLL